ncbi:MAG: IS4 family transposase [Gammaproteobacteria bacterium]|nr:IS4 family transposase [Gammaproteobacteria bacterium]
MSAQKDSRIIGLLASLFPEVWLNFVAREAGAVQRRRKVHFGAFFWSVVLGFGVSKDRSLADMRRRYECSTSSTIEESSYYDRFTRALVDVLRRAVERGLDHLVATTKRELESTWSSFRDLLLLDATVIRLHDLLQKTYRACRTNHTKAAAKMHVVLSVAGQSRNRVKLTSERVHDTSPWKRVGKWVEGRLLLFDLGYYSFHLFARIAENDGFFVSRLKSNSNPLIVATNRKWRGRAVSLVGRRLRDVLPELEREELDVEVEVAFERRAYGGRQRRDRKQFRLVAVRDADSGQYHAYLTNVPRETLTPADVATTYRLRWQIELLFKELRSHYRLGELPSSRRVIVEGLIYTAILTLIVSRVLLAALRAELPPGRWIPHLRWAALFEAVAPEILRQLMKHLGLRPREDSLWSLLLHEAADPNLGRMPHSQLPFDVRGAA